jgi:uncharacterized protein (TIGR01777 family)
MTWDATRPSGWLSAVEGTDGVIHLAGEPIAAKRWSPAQKLRLRESRIDTTRALVEAIAQARNKPRFLINASAVGYYGDRGDETITEESAPGNDFLAELCAAWESEATKANELGLRVALLRTGIVLGKGRGALAKMVPPFKVFMGGRLGTGKQWFPWIHLDDEVGLIKFIIENDKAEGPFNLTSPNPVTMAQFCRVLGRVLNRPAWAPVPPSVLYLMLGEMAEMLLSGQRAVPQAALRLGYNFRFSRVDEALESLGL